MAGVKETREVIDATGAVAVVIARHLKDGFQTSDAAAIALEIAGKKDLQDAIRLANENIKLVPKELKNVDAIDGIELAEAGLAFAKGIVKELRDSK